MYLAFRTYWQSYSITTPRTSVLLSCATRNMNTIHSVIISSHTASRNTNDKTVHRTAKNFEADTIKLPRGCNSSNEDKQIQSTFEKQRRLSTRVSLRKIPTRQFLMMGKKTTTPTPTRVPSIVLSSSTSTKLSRNSTTTNTKSKSTSKNQKQQHQYYTRILKHKRRYCRVEDCNRIVKSQGLCQRHGAKPKKCCLDNCYKQAQGSYSGMCKSHYRTYKGIVPPPTATCTSTSRAFFCTETGTTTTGTNNTNGITQNGSFCQPEIASDNTESSGDDEGSQEYEFDCNGYNDDDSVVVLVKSSGKHAEENDDSNVEEEYFRGEEDIRNYPTLSMDSEIIQTGESYENRSSVQHAKVAASEPWVISPYSSNSGVVRTVHWHDDVLIPPPLSLQDTKEVEDHHHYNDEFCSSTTNDDATGSATTSLLSRPLPISMRGFSTDTQFSFDPQCIDDDLDYEHAFDTSFVISTAIS